MLQYFWSVNTEIPSGLITRNFSPPHIAWAVTVLLLIAAAVPLYRRRSYAAKERIKHVLAVVLVSSEISVWIWKAVIGRYSLQDMLPLHLCGVSVFLEFAAVFGRRTALLREFSYALSMPAALLAVIMPGWSYPLVSFQYLESILLHSLLILIPVLFVWGDGFHPDYRRLPGCFLLLLLFLGMAAAADFRFDANYMFLCGVPQDTLLQVFQSWCGHPGYLFPEIGLMLLLWLILYLPWIAADYRRKGPSPSAP